MVRAISLPTPKARLAAAPASPQLRARERARDRGRDRDPEAAWEKLAPKIVTVTRGWSESYGLFTDGEADMVLSYTTSPAYHIIAEDDRTKKAAIFPEGHYFMVELSAKVAGTDVPELADQFLEFQLSEEFQTMIATGNWSIPARPIPPRCWRMPQPCSGGSDDAGKTHFRSSCGHPVAGPAMAGNRDPGAGDPCLRWRPGPLPVRADAHAAAALYAVEIPHDAHG